MEQAELQVEIREPATGVCVLDLRGQISRTAGSALNAAYQQSCSSAKTILLNCTEVDAVDSAGLGLLIALQARTQRQEQRLVAFGLNAALQQAFAVTHLDTVVPIYADEGKALAAPVDAPPAQVRIAPGAGPQGGWAEPLDRLVVPEVPPEAINLNVQGRRATGTLKGFGPLWQRTYRVRLAGAAVTPAELIGTWKARFASFWPQGGRFYGASRPIQVGDVGLLNLAGPVGTTIATGIFVAYADDESFCFLSVDGHMFGGMITFSAFQEDGATVAQVQALLRSGDPVYELGQRLGFAVRAEDAFWNGALANLAAHFGVEGAAVQQEATLLDPTIHWGRATNLWQSAAMRTMLYLPVRWVRNLFS